MIEQLQLIYEFGPFSLDVGKRRLSRDGQPIPLAPNVRRSSRSWKTPTACSRKTSEFFSSCRYFAGSPWARKDLPRSPVKSLRAAA
jgi:hypothetical protein